MLRHKEVIMHYRYKTRGTCSQMIEFDYENGRVHNVSFLGGCRGNTQGVARLCEGREALDVIQCCEGILCRAGTSCPDQLAKALREALEKEPPAPAAVKAQDAAGADPDCANCPSPCGREAQPPQ